MSEPQGGAVVVPEYRTSFFSDANFHRFFLLSIVLKAVQSAAEVFVGIAIAFMSPAAILAVAGLAANILGETDEFLPRLIAESAQYVAGAGHLLTVVYFLSHGVVKLALIAALLRGKLWAYPAFAALMALFIALQIIQFASTHEVLMIVLSFFDLIVLALTWHEYRFVRRMHAALPA